MSVPVPFGQYVRGDSPVHRLDARTKIVVTAAFTVALFTVQTWLGLGACRGVRRSLAIALSRVSARSVVTRGLRPIAWLLAFTIVINALLPAQRGRGARCRSGSSAVDARGASPRAVLRRCGSCCSCSGTSLVTLTTSPVALTDGLAQLMRPLARLRFPVDDAAMMMSIALRFMPTTAEEAERIVVAQTARGARFDRGGPVARARAWMPVLVPLFVRLFRRADDLAVAMESRCYRGAGSHAACASR